LKPALCSSSRLSPRRWKPDAWELNNVAAALFFAGAFLAARAAFCGVAVFRVALVVALAAGGPASGAWALSVRVLAAVVVVFFVMVNGFHQDPLKFGKIRRLTSN
jgi:hypothetical protein